MCCTMEMLNIKFKFNIANDVSQGNGLSAKMFNVYTDELCVIFNRFVQVIYYMYIKCSDICMTVFQKCRDKKNNKNNFMSEINDVSRRNINF